MKIYSRNYRWLATVLLAALIILLPVWRYAAAGEVQVQIEDDAVNHAHPAGQPFTLQIRVDHDGPGTVRYHWQDFRGRPLTEPEPLEPGELTTTLDLLVSLGLVYVCVDEPRLPGPTVLPPITAVTAECAYLRFHGRNSATISQ